MASPAQSSCCHFLHVASPGLTKESRRRSGQELATEGERGSVPRQAWLSFLKLVLAAAWEAHSLSRGSVC